MWRGGGIVDVIFELKSCLYCLLDCFLYPDCSPLRLVIIIWIIYRAEGGGSHTGDDHHKQAGEVEEGHPHSDHHVKDNMHNSKEVFESVLSVY